MKADPKLDQTPGPGCYAAWRPDPERALHDWKALRRDIARTRWKFVLFGNLGAALLFGAAWGAGALPALSELLEMLSAMLFGGSLVFLGVEFLHVRLKAEKAPLYQVGPGGIRETGVDAPEVRIAWARVRRMQLITDRERPEYRTLKLQLLSGPEWLREFEEYRLPLPPQRASHARPGLPSPSPSPSPEPAATEAEVLAAFDRAFREHGLAYRHEPDGRMVLYRLPEPAPSVPSAAETAASL